VNKFNDLYDFIDFAKGNRKYAENTANGLKSALKIFEKELNLDELDSVELVENNIEEIFVNVVGKNKDKGIGSLNTYKARVLKVIKDYKKYGTNPSKIQNWMTSSHKLSGTKIIKKDITDKREDKPQITLSDNINTPVHKVELSLRDGHKSIILVPKDITIKEAEMIKKIVDSLILK
jgi:hypothetical protein